MGHLKDNDITYFAHMARAFSIGASMIFSGFACLIHAVFPFMFKRTASMTIKRLYFFFRES